MEKIYKVGIIGHGGIGAKHRIFLEKGDVRAAVKGIYDINAERMNEAVLAGYIAYSSVDELLSDKEIDIVLVATSNEVHKDLSIKALGGGMLYDWGVHLIDQIMYMCKEKVTSVYCKMFSINFPEVDDSFRLTMEFEGGLVAHIEVSTNSFIKHNRFYVYGTEGSLVVHEWDGVGKVVRKLAEDNKWDIQIKDAAAGPSKTMAPRNPITVEEIELYEPVDVENYFGPTYKQLINAIEGSPLKIKPEEAMRVLKVIEAAFESNRENKVVNMYV